MNSSRRRLPTETKSAIVEKFSHDGRGIARINGKTTFIDHALPDEKVLFQYTRIKKDFDEGRVVSILTPSPDRVNPPCPHYFSCGGCSLQHLHEDLQIQVKELLLRDQLERIGHCQPKTFLKPLRADSWHYRNKARLSVRYVEKKQQSLVGFREKVNPRYIVDMDSCSVLVERVGKEIAHLKQLIDSFDDPRVIAQVEVAAGDTDIALIFRHLNPLSKEDQTKLREFGDKTGFRLFLQPNDNESVALFYPEQGNDFLTYGLPEYHLQFEFHPTDFTQVNPQMNQKMVSLALDLMDLKPDDVVLDLFCGLGNFSLPMAKYCSWVVGIEGSQRMVSRATKNAALNGINNAMFYCADLEKVKTILHLTQRGFTKMLLDPPRSGALDIVKHIDEFKIHRIVYVSCNSATLARDADVLINEHGYHFRTAGVMDMFPHTNHVESIALFEKG